VALTHPTQPDAATIRPELATAVATAVAEFVAAAPGRAAHVEDLATGFVLGRAGADLRPPTASLAKLPLVAAALVAADAGQLDLTTRVDPHRLSRSQYPSIHGAITTPLTLGELAALAIVLSDNAAAQVVCEYVDPARWADALHVLGLADPGRPPGFTDDHFAELSGLRTDLDAQVAMLRSVATEPVLAPLLGWMGDNLRNTRVSRLIPPPSRFHHKTGTLDGVLHDVGVLRAGHHQLIVVTLTERQVDPVGTEDELTSFGVAVTAAALA